jgi:hypothetical protein
MATEGYGGAASELLGLEVIAASLFEPNVPNFIGGVAGIVTWPTRKVLLRKVGDVTSTCLLAVSPHEIHAIRAHFRLRGFRLGDELARWRRDEASVEAIAVASWTGRPPSWANAVRITRVPVIPSPS